MLLENLELRNAAAPLYTGGGGAIFADGEELLLQVRCGAVRCSNERRNLQPEEGCEFPTGTYQCKGDAPPSRNESNPVRLLAAPGAVTFYQATSCVFTGNSSPLDGGVILSTGGLANLEFIDCLFEGKDSAGAPASVAAQGRIEMMPCVS